MAEQPNDGLPAGPFETSIEAMELWLAARATHPGTGQYDTIHDFLLGRLRAAGVELGTLDLLIVTDVG